MLVLVGSAQLAVTVTQQTGAGTPGAPRVAWQRFCLDRVQLLSQARGPGEAAKCPALLHAGQQVRGIGSLQPALSNSRRGVAACGVSRR